MRKFKLTIAILVIFMTIGFATINYTLSIDGDTNLTGDLDRFQVYFSSIKLNGEENNSLVTSPTRLDINEQLETVGSQHTIEYTITNASEVFNAEIKVNCTPSNEYLSIENQLDTTTNMVPFENRNGTLIIKRTKALASNETIFTRITCNIEATPVSREDIGEGTPLQPLTPLYIGREITIGTEKFNITNITDKNVTMLAQYNIGTNNRQTEETNGIIFSDNTGWEYTPGPKEIDIQTWSPNIHQVLTNYENYLKETLEISSLKADLITLKELGALGCTITDDYGANFTIEHICSNELHKKWLITNQRWWTKSALTNYENFIWYVAESGQIGTYRHFNSHSVRPTITIPKKVAYTLVKQYSVGQEITIGEEKFNVISDNGLTVTMLAKKTVGSNNKQSSTPKSVTFATENQWSASKEALDLNIQEHEGETKSTLNAYIETLKTLTQDKTIKGNLLTLKDLQKLGCTIPENYTWTTDATQRTCETSKYKSWLVTDQSTWTRSTIPSNNISLYVFSSTGKMGWYEYTDTKGVRPIVTIKKETIK